VGSVGEDGTASVIACGKKQRKRKKAGLRATMGLEIKDEEAEIGFRETGDAPKSKLGIILEKNNVELGGEKKEESSIFYVSTKLQKSENGGG